MDLRPEKSLAVEKLYIRREIYVMVICIDEWKNIAASARRKRPCGA